MLGGLRLIRIAIYTVVFSLVGVGVGVGVAVAGEVVITTPQGKVQGQTAGKNASVKVFKGLPYAIPPTGDRRWRPAQAATAWEGVRDASHYAPSCVQTPYAEGSIFASANLPTSEDCLYLNVWSGSAVNEKRPVMVWIHGGALTRGSGSTPSYDGTALAEKGVVAVTINYRLDIFGHFSHPELSAESPQQVSGNQAVSDQLQALHWVQNNIAAYGGDPNQVTIFGESAGSWSVHHLVATPLAKGLVHRAIGQSGAVMDVMQELKEPVNERPAAETVGATLGKAAGAKNLAQLRSMTADDVLALAQAQRFVSRAVVDGYIFPEQIYDMMAAGKQNSVAVMLGFNADEGTILGAYGRVPKDAASYEAQVRATFGDTAADYLKLYPSSDLTKSTLDSFRDSFVTWPMQSWAMFTAKVKQPAYLYYFSHRPPGPAQDRLGAYHAAEIRYAFNNVVQPATDAELAELMSN